MIEQRSSLRRIFALEPAHPHGLDSHVDLGNLIWESVMTLQTWSVLDFWLPYFATHLDWYWVREGRSLVVSSLVVALKRIELRGRVWTRLIR